ncbi:MAG: NADH-quinone oxidoreductase subunit N, partial [Wenzhouxiangellaceae bacterium]
MSLPELQLALPEIIVAAMACVVLIADLYVSEQRRGLTHSLAIVTLLFAIIVTLRGMLPAGETALAFSDTFVRDRFGDVLKIFAYITLLGVFVYAKHFLRQAGLFKGEFYALSLFALLGVMIMISAGSMLTVYLGLELLALCSYALVALDRDSVTGSEAGMKYFILGSLASGVLLYGISLVYGATGSLALNDVAAALSVGVGDDLMLSFGLAFIVVGISFKLGAVPFHMWLPDVYQGAPAAVTLLIASLPKLGYLALAVVLTLRGARWGGQVVSLLRLRWGSGTGVWRFLRSAIHFAMPLAGLFALVEAVEAAGLFGLRGTL